MKTLQAFFIIGLAFLIACSVRGTNWNEHIDSESREQIKKLNEKAIEAFSESNTQKLKELFSDELNQKASVELDTFVKMVHEEMITKEYALLDEYLTTNSRKGNIVTVFKGISGEDDYKISYEAVNKDSYVSILVLGKKERRILLTFIYGKEGNEWKINVLRIGEYSFFEKNAIDFYKLAKINYEKGNLIDAANYMGLSKKIVLPAENYFHYQKEAEMNKFSEKLFLEANAKFPLPMKVNEIESHPQIYNIRAKVVTEGIYPSVSYITKIDLKDSIALKKENAELKKIIGTLFPGIDKEKKYILFKAYNDMPNGTIPVENYGFILDLSENFPNKQN